MKSRVFLICLMCFIFSSCMNTEILPRKEFKEEFPVYFNNNIFIDDVFFKNIYQSKFLLLWNLEYRYVKGDGIIIFIYYDSSYFPEGNSVSVNEIKIKMKNESEIICNNINATKRNWYCESLKKDKETDVPIVKEKNAPNGFVGSYQVEADFDKMIKLRKIKEIEFNVEIEENGVKTEVIKTLHADFKYKTKTQTMLARWVSGF